MSDGPGTVVVVEDDQHISDLVAMYLRREGFRVVQLREGDHAQEAVGRHGARLAIVDVGLPGDVDGFEVTRRLGDRGDRVPVLFLTARDATEDKVYGLTLGADDYLTKPFSLEELVARVRAILRRSSMTTDQTATLRFADLEMDDDTHEVHRGGTRIDLTLTEYKLLRHLLLNAPRVLSKAQILDHVWNYDFGGEGNVVETYISYLRKKVDSLGPPLIHTVRGVGYCLRLPSG